MDKLNEFIDLYKSSTKSSVVMKPTVGVPTIFDTKLGGNPYMPKCFKYPCDIYNRPMKLILQINFEEMPELRDYPDKGILQFFMSTVEEESYMYGTDLIDSTSQKCFRLVYHENILSDIDALVNDFSFVKEATGDNEVYMPMEFNSEYLLRFEEKIERPSLFDSFGALELGVEDIYSMSDEVYDMFWKIEEMEDDNIIKYRSESATKIGGYAHFTQSDPRHPNELESMNYNVLLFSIESLELIEGDNNEEMTTFCWGDAGIANVFINLEDLKKRDFSKVMYSWDCT